MTMTVDEALQAAQTHGGCDTDCVTPELAAEVERLRSENARLNKENDDWHEASKKLREEAQTARLALDVALKEIEALRSGIRHVKQAFERYSPSSIQTFADLASAVGSLPTPPPGAAT